ncbi:hypothetical protein HF086_014295 [Spodoptera exigua]|uniref:FLYWCH-type domain-containing protein n=1 Tax=Spodoptera exigua TaxID=7107 RepID=A0A922M741_SPOEX|nr:hypothetical protein HF086_014295 [Spodoptera exigua]
MTKGGNPVIMIGTYSLHLQPFTEAIFTTTKYGNPVIIFGPYRYNQASAIVSDRSKTRWRCIKRPRGCKSVMYTIGNDIIGLRNEHNH